VRDKSEVLEKFYEVRAAKLRERKHAFLSRSFINCVHNVRLRVKGKGNVGFCQNPLVVSCTKNGMFVCNDDDTARRCKVYCCRHTEASVEADFEEILKSPARCGSEYPKLAMLIWFLQEFEVRGRWARFWSLWKKVGGALWKLICFRWW